MLREKAAKEKTFKDVQIIWGQKERGKQGSQDVCVLHLFFYTLKILQASL